MERVLTSKQKSLEVNLNPHIYGTFAEIGAGQETVRNFFRAGGASGTIAKAMSAYDKKFSDAIYGAEDDGRYVTEARLKKMINWEVGLLEERLSREDHPETCFFAYANTVTTINYARTFKGHGWVGIRFQLKADEDYNEIVFHVRFHENDARLQQETLGVMGTNLVYGAFHYYDNPKKLLLSLYDNLRKDQIEVDMINFSGPQFAYVDNRLMSLQLVKNGFTEAVIFGSDGNNLLPAQLLYKKNIFVLRGSFRPVTKVNMDMLQSGYEKFIKEKRVDAERTETLFEITLSNLKSSGEINERDFLDRTDILCRLGYTVLISSFSEYYKLTDYFNRFTKSRIGLVMGVNNLMEIFDEKYYRDLSGGILEAFGKLFMKDLKLYLYPYINKEDGEKLTSETLKVHPRMKDLYKYFKLNGRVVDLENCDESLLNIYSRKILKKIGNGEKGWEDKLPEGVAEIIKRNGMFGFQKEFDYNVNID
ncbi:MAG: TonB-dependent receptor [Flavobacteriales bacterium]